MIADFKAEFPPATRVLPTLLATRAAQYGDAGLFACGATRLSYDQTRGAASRAAQALMDAGIAQGDRVAIICGNRAEFMPVFLGCGWMGAVSSPGGGSTLPCTPQVEV